MNLAHLNHFQKAKLSFFSENKLNQAKSIANIYTIFISSRTQTFILRIQKMLHLSSFSAWFDFNYFS